MLRKRTSKSISKRHDLDYFKKGSPLRLWQWRLSAIALIAAIIWIATTHTQTAFSAGPISAPHAVFAQKCETCHKPVIPGAGWLPLIGARHNVPDTACLSCHQVGPHHTENGTKSCSSCHLEHIGAMHLASAPVKGCTQCHANLEPHIKTFTKGHPDFKILRTSTPEIRAAAFGLKFNHQSHLEPNLTGPNSSKTTLNCASCHRISDMGERGTAQSGRMAPVDFDRSCRSCHSLEFDKRIAEQAPHADAATVLHFVQQKMAPYNEASLISAETIIFRQKCSLCHTITGSENLPQALTTSLTISPSHQPDRFFTAAIFSHSSHSAVECTECHTAALSSTSGKDFLLPHISTCQRCHDGQSNPQGPLPSGHAESGCSLCHQYHQGGRQHTTGASPTFRIDDLLPTH